MKKAFILIITLAMMMFSGCTTNMEDNMNKQIETVQQYVETMQNGLDFLEIESDFNNPNVSKFTNGIRFKYLDGYFELYQVNDEEFIRQANELGMFHYNDGEVVFNISDIFNENLPDLIDQPNFLDLMKQNYTVFVNGNFILIPTELSQNTAPFIKTYHRLLNAYFEVEM